MNIIDEEKCILIKAIEKATEGQNVEYIICDDMLEFGKHESLLNGKEYVIQQFGNYYVALIFK